MEDIKKLFDTTDLFSILNITEEKAADSKALKGAYLRTCLSVHPDKGPEAERELRTQKFQVLQKIYELLQDDDLRKSYVETGEWPEKDEFSIDLSAFGKKLNETDILEFKRMYIGSEEERQDVKKFYEEGNGNIVHVIENLYFANILDDRTRVQEIIDDLIEKGAMKKLTKGLASEKAIDKKVQKAKKEAKEAEELRKEMNMDEGMDSLRIAMAKNGAKRASFLDDMEKKYSAMEAKKGKGKGKAAEKHKSKNDDGQDEVPAKKAKKAEAPRGESSGRVTRSTRSKN